MVPTELAAVIAAVVGGWGAFRLGGGSVAHGGRLGLGCIMLAVLAALATALTTLLACRYPAVRDVSGQVFLYLGGEELVGCFAALLLLGAVKATPTRTTSDGFVRLAAGLAFAVIFGVTASPLAWHWCGADLRENLPGDEGLLTQTTAVTCAPWKLPLGARRLPV